MGGSNGRILNMTPGKAKVDMQKVDEALQTTFQVYVESGNMPRQSQKDYCGTIMCLESAFTH